jgi:beta-lactamase class A
MSDTELRSEPQEDLRRIFDEAAATAAMHVRDLDTGAELGLDADELVVTASVFKLSVLVELCRQASAGQLSLTERVRVPAGERCMGPTGLSVMLDDAELSLRDLAYLMISVSDNTATDVVLGRVRVEAVNATIRSLGLERTVLVGDCALLLGTLLEDLGSPPALTRWTDLDPDLLATARTMTATETNRTTPREITELLRLVWTDRAGPADACAEVRRILGLQVWPHRLSSGFGDGIRVSGKTGTLPGLRNEVGVVEYPDGGRYAVAVFTRARSYTEHQPAIDASIGSAARAAVEHLRASVR